MTDLDSTPRTSDADATLAERLLARCLLAQSGDRERKVAELCARYPDAADELRELWEQFRDLRGAGFFRGREGEELGDFRILSRIGEGGMGFVYLAEQRSLGRKVALKVLRPELTLSDRSRERFRREARAIASLSHPNIVPVHAYGECEGFGFLAMEWIEGRSLGDALARLHRQHPAKLTGVDLAVAVGAPIYHDGEVETPELFRGGWAAVCAKIGRAVADALDHAHGRDVIHRDVKPSNVLVARDGRVLLLDFGLAKTGGELGITRTGVQPGSLAYMAPEQVSSSAGTVAASTDIYALGVTLYELLTFEQPFEADTPVGLMHKIVEVDMPRVRVRNRSVPHDLETIVLTAAEKGAAARYRSAGELRADLDRFLIGEPVLARKASWVRRSLRRLRRRGRRIAISAAIVLTLAVVGVQAVIAWQRHERRQAERFEKEATLFLEEGVANLGMRGIEPSDLEPLALAFSRKPDILALGALVIGEHAVRGVDAARSRIEQDRDRFAATPDLRWVEASIERAAGNADVAQGLELRAPIDSVQSSLLRAWAARESIVRGEHGVLLKTIDLLRTARARAPEPVRLLDCEFALCLALDPRLELDEERATVAVELERRWPDSRRARVLAGFVIPVPRAPATEDPNAEAARGVVTNAVEAASEDEVAVLLAKLGKRKALDLAHAWETRVELSDACQLAASEIFRIFGEPARGLSLLQSRAEGPWRIPYGLELWPRVVDLACRIDAGVIEDMKSALEAVGESPAEQARLAVQKAKYDVANGRHELARVSLRAAVDLVPDLFEAWKLSARVDYELKQYDSAVAASRQATRLGRDASVWRLLGKCHEYRREPNEALRAYEEGLRITPESNKLRMYYAGALRRFGKPHRALDLYERLVNEAPADPELWMGAMRAALSCGERKLAAHWLERIESHFDDRELLDDQIAHIAICLRSTANAQQAFDRVRARAERPSASSFLRTEFAHCLNALGKPDVAIDILRDVLDKEENPRPWGYYLAQLLAGAKRQREAVEVVHATAVADPDSSVAVLEVSRIHAKVDLDEAIRILERYAASGRMTVDLFYDLGWYRMRRYTQQPSRPSFPRRAELVDLAHAVDAFWNAIEIDPDAMLPRFRIASCLRRLGFLTEARLQLDAMRDTPFKVVRLSRVEKMKAWVHKEIELCERDQAYEFSRGRLMQVTAVSSARTAEQAGRLAVAAKLWQELWRQAEYGFDAVDGEDFRFDAARCLVMASSEEGVPDTEAARLRMQALAWFEQRLAIVEPLLALPRLRELIVPWLRRWRESEAFVVVRTGPFDSFPDGERDRWHRAWKKLDALLQ
ncbi:MAG: protein kinase [Planctomycetes bacterium]|nr:protein kinase [Planctomycetota bacterium]